MNPYELLSRDNYVTINKIVMRKIGIDAALLLSELCYRRQYLDRAGKLQEDGFFYATVQDIEEETTLNEYSQNKAMNVLKDMGVVKSERRGLPAKRYLYIDSQKLGDLLSEPTENSGFGNSEQVPENLGNKNLKSSVLNSNNNTNNKSSSKIGHSRARGSKEGSLIQAPTKTRRTSVQKVNSFISACEREMNKIVFSDEVRTQLMKFFRMLAESNSLLPSSTIQEQLKLLSEVREDKQADVVKNTIMHGWKSLSYEANNFISGSTPSWDTATPGSFQPKTEEEKSRDIFEGVSEEEIF